MRLSPLARVDLCWPDDVLEHLLVDRCERTAAGPHVVPAHRTQLPARGWLAPRPMQVAALGWRMLEQQLQAHLGDRITGASRPAKGTKIGLLDKLKDSLPNIGIKRLQALTF